MTVSIEDTLDKIQRIRNFQAIAIIVGAISLAAMSFPDLLLVVIPVIVILVVSGCKILNLREGL